jgi:tetratricopeptide (TPR) repeat protein
VVLRLAYETGVSVLAACTGVLAAGVLLFAFEEPTAGWRLAVFGIWATLVLGMGWWRFARPMRAWRDIRRVARLLEDSIPSLRTDVTASLQFGAEIEEIRAQQRVSVGLVERLLEETAQTVAEVRPQLGRAVPRVDLRWTWVVAMAAVLGLAAGGLVAPEATARGLRGLVLGSASATSVSGPLKRPLVGDITLTFQYPDYTGLGRRTLHGSTGEVQVLRGTRVEISATALTPVQRADLVLTTTGALGDEDADTSDKGPQRLVLERRPGGRLVTAFTALRSGSYTIEAVLADGREAYDGITRPIVVAADRDPKINLLRPDGEIDVSPQDQVTFAYEASDDFGLTEVAINTAFSLGAETEKGRKIVQSADSAEAARLPGDARPTQEASSDARQWTGEHVLDLAPLQLQPKDRLVVHLEAVDNDTISGPKIVSSRTVVLRVSSPEDKHLEIIAAQEEIFEALLDVLGDYLERPVGERWNTDRGKSAEGIPDSWTQTEFGPRYAVALPPHEKAGKILDAMATLLESMEQDPLMIQRDYALFQRTHANLGALRRAEGRTLEGMRTAATRESLQRGQMERLFAARKKTTRGTERAIVAIEDLIAAMRMENVLESAKDLKEAQERLRELLEKYKNTNDPALKKEILKQLQRMRERMREMLAKMREQLQDLPKEHMNMEAFQRESIMAQTRDLKDTMDKIMEHLENGDIDAAMKELEQMSADMDSMLSQMEGEFSEMQPQGLSELDKRVSELMDELSDLENQEKAIQKDTKAIEKEMNDANQERRKKALEAFKERELEKIRALKKEIEQVERKGLARHEQESLDRAARNAERLERSLESGDIAQALGEAKDLERRLSSLGTDLGFQRRYMRPNDPRKPGYAKAAKGVKAAQPKAKEIADDLQKLMDGTRPRPTAEQAGKLQELAEQQGSVKGKTGELRKKLGEDTEFPMLGEELGPGLGEAEKFMEGAGQRLGQGQPRRAGENEKLALDKLGGLKRQLRRSLAKKRREGQGGQGGQSVRREDVEIPDEDRRAPREFREDILEAMKEQQLDGYQDELRQYYESLVR